MLARNVPLFGKPGPSDRSRAEGRLPLPPGTSTLNAAHMHIDTALYGTYEYRTLQVLHGRVVHFKHGFSPFQKYVFKYEWGSFSNMAFSKRPVFGRKIGVFSKTPLFEMIIPHDLTLNITVKIAENGMFSKIKSRRKSATYTSGQFRPAGEALGGTEPWPRDAEAEATGGLASEGHGRRVEPIRGTGGSPRLLRGISGGYGGYGGSSGSSGGGGGGGGGGSYRRGYIAQYGR